MTLTINLVLKPVPVSLMSTNSNFSQRSSFCQNPPLINITNPVNKLNFTLDNDDKKTNIIINFFYTK